MATIKSVTLSLEDINNIISTKKSPIDIANNIKGYTSSPKETLDKMQMIISALGTLETFASTISRYKTSIPGIGLNSVSLILNIKQAFLEITPIEEGGYGYGNITNRTFNSIMADLSSLMTNAGLAIKNPYLVGLGLTSSIGFSIAAFLSTDGDTSIADSIVEFANTLSKEFDSIQDSLNIYARENNTDIDSMIQESVKVHNELQTSHSKVIDNSSSLAKGLKENEIKETVSLKKISKEQYQLEKLSELEKKAQELLDMSYDSYIEEKSRCSKEENSENKEHFSFSSNSSFNQTNQSIQVMQQ